MAIGPDWHTEVHGFKVFFGQLSQDTFTRQTAMGSFAPKAKKPPSDPWLKPRLGQWSASSMTSAWTTQPSSIPSFVTDVVRAHGQPLERADGDVMGSRFDFDFSKVRVHTDERAANSAERLGAAAYTAGWHLVFAPGQYAPNTGSGRQLLAHELAHVVQSQQRSTESASVPSSMVLDAAAEQQAQAWTEGRDRPKGHQSAPLFAMRPSIATKILQFAAKQLEKRTVKTVSKHIARHATRIAGRAIHTIFRNPREIRYLLQRTVREAIEIAAKHSAAGTEHVVEEGAIRITRQATGTPGKFRLLIQKVFDREIGTQGERVLRMVLDQTGRIVTAFPADRLITIGLTAAGIDALTEGTARAGEAVKGQVARAEAAQKAREEKIDLWDWVPLIGDIWGGSLNEGEDEMLRQDREIAQLVKDAIDDVEKSEQRKLTASQRQELDQLIRAAIASPLIMEDTDPGDGD